MLPCGEGIRAHHGESAKEIEKKKTGKREENLLQGARCVGQTPGEVEKTEKGTFAERRSFGSSSVSWYHFLQPGKGAEGRES